MSCDVRSAGPAIPPESMNQLKPIVVTGSSGFVGSALIKSLKGFGYTSVLGLDRVDGPMTDSLTDFGTNSVEKMIPEGSIIVHLGGLSTHGQCVGDPTAAVQSNVLGTINLAASAKSSGAEQFIFASSEWVYGEYTDSRLLEEDDGLDLLSNESLYAQTKLAAEGFLRRLDSLANLTILRFAIVYGPRSSPSSAPESILSDCLQGNLVTVGNASSARRFIFLDDLVSGIIASFDHQGTATFNLAGPDLYSLQNVYEAATTISGNSPGFEANISSTPSIRNLSSSKAKTTLGWKATTHIVEGLRMVAAGQSLNRQPQASPNKGPAK